MHTDTHNVQVLIVSGQKKKATLIKRLQRHRSNPAGSRQNWDTSVNCPDYDINSWIKGRHESQTGLISYCTSSLCSMLAQTGCCYGAYTQKPLTHNSTQTAVVDMKEWRIHSQHDEKYWEWLQQRDTHLLTAQAKSREMFSLTKKRKICISLP